MTTPSYLTSNISPSFSQKPIMLQRLFNEALHILENLGIPLADKTPRRLERLAAVFLALCDVKKTTDWPQARSLQTSYALKTREIIAYMNQHFGESISSGSYDDIRRKDLKHPILARLVITNQPLSAHNNPGRAWGINPEFAPLIQAYKQPGWSELLTKFWQGRSKWSENLATKRDIPIIPIQLPSGDVLEFGQGVHNQLQKAIVEQFLPRYGYGATLIYVGDAENKFLYYEQGLAHEIGLLPLAHEQLPDVVAYSAKKNWLYLIEAVHTSGAITPERIAFLQPLVANSPAKIIYVTAFWDRVTFRKFAADIAWETESWIASEPDHLIHFNGSKFLGPYQ